MVWAIVLLKCWKKGTILWQINQVNENFEIAFGYWDLCAPDAIFREIGGGIFWLNKELINYTNACSKEYNEYDIIIGDNKNKISYCLQQFKLLNKI